MENEPTRCRPVSKVSPKAAQEKDGGGSKRSGSPVLLQIPEGPWA